MQKIIQITLVGFGLLMICVYNLNAQNGTFKQDTSRARAIEYMKKWPKYYDRIIVGGHNTRTNLDSSNRENALNNSEFVFEGILRSFTANYDSVDFMNDPGIAYYIADVNRVFKGTLSAKTVKVLFRRSQWDPLGNTDLRGRKDSIAIFFCKTTTKYKDYFSKEAVGNKNLTILYGVNEMGDCGTNSILISYDRNTYGLYMLFQDIANCYSYLRSRKGLNIPPYVAPKQVLPPPEPGTNRLTPAQMDSLSLEMDKISKENMRKNLKH